MLQRLPIAVAQVTAGNNSENLLNETRQIVYSLYQSKEITKKVYNNTSKSIQLRVQKTLAAKSNVKFCSITYKQRILYL